ncbi:MAG: HYR domain-containing protein, partial [Acidobacteria bacterium]|nr:HYR domain-containing protein [Acidobacteriota bacterium]
MRSPVVARSLIALAAIALLTTLFALTWERHAPRVAAQSTCVQPPSGMVSWWPGDSTANDVQGSNNGALQNGATFAAGEVGQGFFFDGVDDFVRVPHNTNLDPGTGSFTIDAWIKTTKTTGSQIIVSKYECGQACPPGVANSIYFVTIKDGKLETTIRDTDASAPGIQVLAGATFLADGNFHHVVMLRDIAASQLRLYVDGVLDASAALNAAADGAIKDDDGEPDPFLIGARFVGGATTKTEFFSGIIDEVEFFNRALATSEIQSIVSAGSAGKCKTIMVAVDPKATYLRTTCDNPALPTIVDLAALGFAPGDRLKLSYSVAPPGFSFVCGQTPVGAEQTTVLGVFSNSNTLLPLSVQPRIPGAIEAGDDVGTGPNFFCNEANDIPQDFRLFPPGGLIIQLPAGATHLFLGVGDSYWADNCGSIKVTVERAPNRPPVATCQNVTVSAGATCTAAASIDNGSSDPDGDAFTLTQAPAGPYPLGNTSVTLTVTDSKGAASQCTAIVTVVDTTPPQITSPANAVYQCLSQVPPGSPSQATATDNCSTPTITVADASNGGAGSTASPLVITRVFVAKDAANNSNSATQTITVIDDTPPTISAPLAVNIATGPGATTCGAIVSEAMLGTATANDNCGSATITRSGVPSGNFFPVGATTLTYTANDGHGNTAMATQTVTVVDNTPPTISAPPTVNAATGAGATACSVVISDATLGAATANDNCTVTVTRSGVPAGNLFPVGTTTLTYTANDGNGNMATATQTVTVIDNTPPLLNCPANIIKPTDPGQCSAVVNFTVTATDNCPGVTVVSSPPAGSVFPPGMTTVTTTATDAAGNSATCSFTVTVNDTEQPLISCPAGTTVAANASCQAAVPNVLGSVTAADNCTPLGALTKTQSPAAGTLAGLGTTTITVTVSDVAGNSNTCTTTVTVVDSTPPVITACAASQAANANANCQAALPDFTGAVTATDNCTASGALTITQSPAAGTLVGLGTTAVTLTVRDAAGNTSTCATSFTVADHTNPVLSNCPSPITVYTGAGATACAATASWTPPTAADSCGSPTLTSSHNPGATFPVGTTTVTYTARDVAGNQASCSFTVTVIDNTPPVIACPANVAMFCGATVNPGVATATDNCAGVTVAGVRSDGQPLNAPYPLGTTTITWRATDAAGNQAACQQTVMVTNPPPVATITGPATGSVYAAGTLVNFTGSFTDNAGGTHTATWAFDNLTSAGTVNETTGAITGSFTFTAAGVYKVTLTVTDNCGGAHTTDVIGPDGLTELVVIYDASAGWVTGGGWINSPAGAYVPIPSLTGKANFGFVSKYQNGNSVPTGNTDFQFKAGNLNFHSTSYEWMVIAGARAQYKGAGTINGAGDYRFMLTAIDGDQPGGGGADKFRIRIWNNTGGGLV